MILPRLYLIENSQTNSHVIIWKLLNESIKTTIYPGSSITFIFKDKSVAIFTPKHIHSCYGTIDGNFQRFGFNLFECYDLGYTTDEIIYWLNNLEEYYKLLNNEWERKVIYMEERN